ncbi:MAG: CoA ester lyase [Chloroflexi bacterium]|nr:CoA ester lyase [Chloroflexota bacterium]
MRRCLLFVPADQDAKLRKAATLPCDGVILDLEDGVGSAGKREARAAALRALEEIDFGPRERLLRINGFLSPWAADDLAALRDARVAPDTVVIPKVNGPDQERAVIRALEDRPLQLVAAIESARGVFAAREIAAFSPQVTGLLFGDGDYLADTGGQRTSRTLLYPRSIVVAAAASAGLNAIDTPYLRLGDLAGLEDDAREAAELGFVGKAAIHPEQLPIINAVFTPPPEQIAWAERVLAASSSPAQGVFVIDGVMADAMTVRIAERVLAAARVPNGYRRGSE